MSPDQAYVKNYIRKRPVAMFNPGAVINGSKLIIFPRLVFDYYWYMSCIGVLVLTLRNYYQALILIGMMLE